MIDIHGKKLIALAGYDVFGKSFINVVNKEIASDGLMVIGININDDDFNFFISNLPNSKVEITIFMPEFQKRAADFFKVGDFLLASVKNADSLKFLTSKEGKIVDDKGLLEIIKILKESYGV